MLSQTVILIEESNLLECARDAVIWCLVCVDDF